MAEQLPHPVALYTMGVFGKTEQQFFETLVSNQIQLFLDVRRRLGVRGKEYSFVNKQRLKQRLAELQIDFAHEINLSPSPTTRAAQREADAKSNQAKRQREVLAPVFCAGYQQDISNFDYQNLYENYLARYGRILLFCVEGPHTACHRSLLAEELSRRFAPLTIHHL